jgi:uncharacterized damage-inducible protein DinB
MRQMVDVRKLLAYNEEVRHRYFNTLTALPWEEVIENREASFHSLRNIFVHILNAINYWLDVLLTENLYIRRKYDEYENIDDIEQYMTQVETRLREFLTSITPDDYETIIRIPNNTAGSNTISIEDVLIHLFEEEVHHRGELIALFWQMGVEPPAMSWKNL